MLKIGPPQSLSGAGRFSSLSICPDGRTLAVADQGRAQGVVLDLRGKAEGIRLGHHPKMTHIAISPDGRWVATGPYRTDGTAITKIWDARTGKLAKDLPARLIAGDSCVGFSGDGEWLVTGTPEVFRFWRAGSWEPVHVIGREQGGSMPGPLACTRDGRVVAIGRSATMVQLLDPRTGRELASLVTPDARRIYHLCFSSDGSHLAAGRDNQVITLWDLRQIRKQLAAIGLDWDRSPYQPARAGYPPRQARGND
jgi:WD40 repeat protein